MRGSDQKLRYAWGHIPEDLRLYGVTSGERSVEEAEGFLSFTWMRDRVRPALNASRAGVLTQNKWAFYRLMDGFGIPIPRTLGLYDPLYGLSWDGQRRLRTPADVVAEVARVRPAGLVLKPAGGQQGRGLVILDEIDHGAGRGVTRTGEGISVSAAVESVDVAGMGGVPGYIVQEPVPSHPVYQALAPWTTNTLRVVTLLDGSGEVHVQAAATILGRKGNMANNWHAGGVNVGVDVQTGVLGRGLLLDEPGWMTTHPDTGAEFTGTAVPHWGEVMDVCRRAAVLLPGTRSIGWDVVVTPQGPVVLEANDQWHLSVVQVHGTGFLADERIRAQLQAAGAPLPTGNPLTGVAGRLWKETPRRIKRALHL